MQNQAQNDVSFFAPVCEVCQSQDETLRAVSYPLVFSVIFATFRRAFSGVFCARHQRRYHLLASLITSIAGWLGIPFGLFLTPLTLFKLARGGDVNVEESLQILDLVADKQLRTGDIKGAIRCLEEYLKLRDSAEIREKLTRLYSQSRDTIDVTIPESIWQFLGVSMLLMFSMITGLLIGLIDMLIIYLLSSLIGGSESIIDAILSWLPTVTMLFFEVLFIRFLLRWTLNKGRITSAPLGIALATGSTFLAFYSFLEGRSILVNLQGLLTFFSISNPDGIFALRSVLAHGGIDMLINLFEQGFLSDIIFGILFASGIFLSLYVGVEMATRTARWQNSLYQLRSAMAVETNQSSTSAWVTFTCIALGILFISALIYPGSYVDTRQTYLEISLGMTEMDQNHDQEAVTHFNNAVDLWDTSVSSHMFLGTGYLSQEKYDQAMEQFERGLNLDPNSMITHLGRGYGLTAQGRHREALDEYKYVLVSRPEWGLPHAALAVSYYLLDEVELASKEIQLALAYEEGDGQTSSVIAYYYAQKLDFKEAEEHALKAVKVSGDPGDYIPLARVYMSQNKIERAQKVIEEADRQGADPLDVYLARINMAEFQNDLETASSILVEAMKQYPNESDLFAESSYILFHQNQIDQSAADAEKAVALNPYNSLGYDEMAFAYHAQGRYDDALAAAKKSIALYPKYDRAHYILGLCYMELGMNEEAIKEFETFLDLYWERPLAKEYKENAVMYLEQLK